MPLETHYSSYSTASLGRYNRDSKTRWRTISSTASSGVGSSNLFISSRNVSGVDIDNVYGFSRSSPLSFDIPYETSVSSSRLNSKYVSRSSPASYARESRTEDSTTTKHRRQAQNISKRILSERNNSPSHRFQSNDSSHLMSAAEIVRTQFNEDRSYYPCSRKSKAFTRSVTTDLGTDLSLINSSYSYHRNVAAHLGHEMPFHRNYRPIFIQRPSITSFAARPSEEKLRLPTRPVRRDRPLVKFVEREDLNPDKVRNLLNAWARGGHVEQKPAEEEAENRKRESVQSDDSGIGSFHNSRRSRQKSGEFEHEVIIKCDDGGNFLPKEKVDEGSRLTNASAADEGVHFETGDLALLTGKELPKIVNNSVQAGKTSVENAVNKTDPNAGGQILRESDSAVNVSQNTKRRVRISADENIISSEPKLEFADENNNKLSRQISSNVEMLVCSTSVDASILEHTTNDNVSDLNKEKESEVVRREKSLVNESIFPESNNVTQNTLANTENSDINDFKESHKSQDRNISIEKSAIKCMKDEPADPEQFPRNENKTVLTELSKFNQSAQTLTAKEIVCEHTEANEQQKIEKKVVTSSILLDKISEQDCSPKSLEVKKKKKIRNLDGERKKVKPKVFKGDDINENINNFLESTIAPDNSKKSYSVNSEISEEEKESKTLEEGKSDFEQKMKIVKNADILTEQTKSTVIDPESKVNLKNNGLIYNKKNTTNGTEINSATKLKGKEKANFAEKPRFKEIPAVSIDSEEQKTIFLDVENKSHKNNFNHEGPIANINSGVLDKEPEPKTTKKTRPDKTDIQLSSDIQLFIKEKRLLDTGKQVQQLTNSQSIVSVHKSQSDDFTVRANGCGGNKTADPSRKSSFGEYTSVSKEIIERDTTEQSSDTKHATKESAGKCNSIIHNSNARRSTIGECPIRNSNKALYLLQKSLSSDNKTIMKELSSSDDTQHLRKFLSSKANKVKILNITESKSESIKFIPGENNSSLRETSDVVCRNICIDETLLPVNIGKVITVSKDNDQSLAETAKAKSEAGSSFFKSDNKTFSENCKEKKQAVLLNENGMAKSNRNDEAAFASEKSGLSNLPSRHTLNKIKVEENANGEKLYTSSNKMKTEENGTMASKKIYTKNTLDKFQKELQPCKNNNYHSIFTADKTAKDKISNQSLQENYYSSLKNNSNAKNMETDSSPNYSQIIMTSENVQTQTAEVSNKPENLVMNNMTSNDIQFAKVKSEIYPEKIAPHLTKYDKKFFRKTKLMSDIDGQDSAISQTTKNNKDKIIKSYDSTQEDLPIVSNKSKVLSTTCTMANETQIVSLKSKTDTDKIKSQDSVTPQTTDCSFQVSDKQTSALQTMSIKNITNTLDTSDCNAGCKHQKDVSKNVASHFSEAAKCITQVRDDPGMPENIKARHDKTKNPNNSSTKQMKLLVSPLEQQEKQMHNLPKVSSNHDNIESFSSNFVKQRKETRSKSSYGDSVQLLQKDVRPLKHNITDNNGLRRVFNNKISNTPNQSFDVQQVMLLKSQKKQINKPSDEALDIAQNTFIERKLSEFTIENKKDRVIFNEKSENVLLKNQTGHCSDVTFLKPISTAQDDINENEPKSSITNSMLLPPEELRIPVTVHKPLCLNGKETESQVIVDKPPIKKKKVKTENENETPNKKKRKRKISKQTIPEGKKERDIADNETFNSYVTEETENKDRIGDKQFSAGINSTPCTGGEKQLLHPGESTKNAAVQKIDLDDLWIDYCDLTEECAKVLVETHETPDVLHPVPISIEDFNLLKVLGRGSYGKVMLAELKGRRQYYAIKCLKKHVVQEDNDVECTMIEREVLVMGSKQPYLCTLFCTFQNESHLFFVMEYLSGGDLMFHIQQSGRFEEDRARFYAAEIVCALKYLHKYGIIYRDAKLDNICIDADGHVRLVDFGFCKLRIYRKECLPRNLCGTPDYMAPEIIKGQHYNQSVDWWSFGVLLYEMLTGQSPFNGADEEELFWSVCNEEVFYPRYISKEAKELLALLLNKNPEKRLGMPGCDAGDIYGQSFFHFVDWVKVERKEMEPPFKPKLKSETDVSNFDSDFTMERAVLTPTEREILVTVDQEQFVGFSYTNSSMFC